MGKGSVCSCHDNKVRTSLINYYNYLFNLFYFARCVEMGKLKCAQYWPDDGKSPAVFGGVAITVLEHEQKSSFEYRKLSVQNNVSVIL